MFASPLRAGSPVFSGKMIVYLMRGRETSLVPDDLEASMTISALS